MFFLKLNWKKWSSYWFIDLLIDKIILIFLIDKKVKRNIDWIYMRGGSKNIFWFYFIYVNRCLKVNLIFVYKKKNKNILMRGESMCNFIIYNMVYDKYKVVVKFENC